MKVLTYEDLVKAVEQCRYGKSFSVATESERKQALMIAKAQQKKITTRKRSKGGFAVFVLE